MKIIGPSGSSSLWDHEKIGQQQNRCRPATPGDMMYGVGEVVSTISALDAADGSIVAVAVGKCPLPRFCQADSFPLLVTATFAILVVQFYI